MLSIFAADSSDIEWMTRLYIEAAKEQHFKVAVSSAQNRAFIRRNISSMIQQQVMVDFGLETQTLVFETRGKKIGYVVMSAVRRDPTSAEIHLFVVDSKHRGKGYGRLMLNEIIKRWHTSVTIYARCYPASGIMQKMLLKSGFMCVSASGESPSLLALYRQNPDPVVSISTPENLPSQHPS